MCKGSTCTVNSTEMRMGTGDFVKNIARVVEMSASLNRSNVLKHCQTKVMNDNIQLNVLN